MHGQRRHYVYATWAAIIVNATDINERGLEPRLQKRLKGLCCARSCPVPCALCPLPSAPCRWSHSSTCRAKSATRCTVDRSGPLTTSPRLTTCARAIIRPVCFHPAGLASLQPRRLAVVVFCVITTRLAFCLCFTPICRCCCSPSRSRCCCCCIAIFALIETLKCDKCRVKSCMHANCPLHPFH